ncbi:hypothetical protein M5X11_34355 [Paenibacillus alginolyticus]|uniref:hypothetical protein n=1 Tax=Paenibacillus alginolyticus TaxID=59839 RepID=UPI0003FEE0CF|nr:hypothetical protein [Paenibacillus alginolyticus]MCY9669931.1 hypothetical protein [Paenibacillus alginolyticus]
MPRKTKGWLRKMRELGLGHQGFGGWMSGSELMVQRGNFRAVQERQGRNIAVLEQLGLVRGRNSAVHEQARFAHDKKAVHEQQGFVQSKKAVHEQQGFVQSKKAVHEQQGFVQSKMSVVQKNNVYPLLPRKAAAKIPALSPIAILEADKWVLRKQLIIQIAKRRSGKVRLQEVAAECNVNIRIAADWLKRLSLEGMISLVAGERNVRVYSLKDVGRVHK